MSNNLKDAKVLITGASGFIGSFLVKELLKEPVKEILIYDNFTRGKIENIKDNERILIKWLILLPIKTNTKDNRIPIKKTGVTFKLVKLKPCSVAMIFQIDKIHVRKKDEMIKNIARDLNFISPLSN